MTSSGVHYSAICSGSLDAIINQKLNILYALGMHAHGSSK